MEAFAARLAGGHATAAAYERPDLLAKARAAVPIARLKATACAALLAGCMQPMQPAGAGEEEEASPRGDASSLRLHAAAPPATTPPPAAPAPPLCYHDAFLIALLRWWKDEHFEWVNSPACERCGGATQHSGMAPPTPEEARFGAGRVEAYACGSCGAATRFPRYNDPSKLLDMRRGRCGEWANAFTLTCLSLGLTARYVLDWTDHGAVVSVHARARTS